MTDTDQQLSIDDQVKKLGRIGAFAHGSYWCKCTACGVHFEGDKRALNCLPCAVAAIAALEKKVAELTKQVGRLEGGEMYRAFLDNFKGSSPGYRPGDALNPFTKVPHKGTIG